MMKRISLMLALLAVAIAPFAPGIASGDETEWTALTASRAWSYDGFRVERLTESSTNLMKLGDTLVLVKRAAACSGSCDLRDLLLLGNGGTITVENVQTSAVDLAQFAKNGNRLVYAEESGKEARFDVIEVDLATGQKITLLDDAFIGNVEDVMITVDGEMIYATATYNHSSDSGMVPQSQVFAYMTRYDSFKPMYVQWNLRYETLEDVEDGQAIVKMTFPDGEEQLWVYDFIDFGEQEGTAIADTWTPEPEDIVGAHFAKDGDVEFFRMYARTVADESFDSTTVTTDYLSWYREFDLNDLSNLVQINGSYMAYVTPENDLYVSNGESTAFIANIGMTGTFRLMEETILWENGSTGGITTVDGVMVESFDFRPTDILGNIVVGLTGAGDVFYRDMSTDNEMTIGFGGVPYIADARHVYWKGEDAKLYEATLLLDTAMNTAVGTPVKTASSPKVYMLIGDEISYIPNETIYLTWYETFADVVVISDTQLATYDEGDSVGYKPGTLVKLATSSKIYVIGDDHKMHWIVKAATASDLYGDDWSDQVVTVSAHEMTDYGYGANIDSENSLAKTVMVATVK